jgi:hypothetical protein
MRPRAAQVSRSQTAGSRVEEKTMKTSRNALWLLPLAWLAVSAATPVFADRDDDDDDDRGRRWREHRGRDYKETVREGPCRVYREWKSDGSYKEERECKGAGGGAEFEKKYQDGPCKIEREGKADGTYKEKIDCLR